MFYYKKKFDLEYILILLIPIFAVLSIFLLEILFIIISIIFLIKLFKNKLWIYFNNFFYKFIFFFYLYIVFNFFFQSTSINTLSIIFYFRYLIYAISIYYFLDTKRGLFYDLCKLVFYVSVILSFDAIFQSIFKYNVVGFKIIQNHRASSFFGDELILGSFLFKMLPFIFLFFLIKKKNYIYVTFFSIIFLLAIFLSGERTSLLLSTILLIIYFFYFEKKNLFKILKIFTPILILICLIFFTQNKEIRTRYLQQPFQDLTNKYIVTQHMLKDYEYKPKIIFFSGLHHNMMITSIRIFQDNIIFGSGPRSYRDVCDKYKINYYSCQNHPHNFYLQILSETGVVGFLFLILLYLIIFFKIYKIFKLKDFRHKLALIILFYYAVALWPIIPSGNIFNNWISILLYMPAAFYLCIMNSKKIFYEKKD